MPTPLPKSDRAPRSERPPEPERFQLGRFLKGLGRSISCNQTTDLAAQLAYFSILSLFPFAIFMLTVVGFIPMEGLDAQITDFIHRAMPPEAAKLVDQTLHEIVGRERSGLLIVSILGALWSASAGTSSTMTALNRAYGVSETRPFWKAKLVALGSTAAAAVLLIVIMVALIAGPGIVHRLTDWIGLGETFDRIWGWVRWPLIVATMMVMLAGMYFFLPNVKQKFRLISPGAVAAVLIWIGATLGFNFYLEKFSSYAATYGALGAVIVLLTWLYISGFVVILGGEINALLDRTLKGIEHRERQPGPVTRPDRGLVKGDVRPRAANSPSATDARAA